MAYILMGIILLFFAAYYMEDGRIESTGFSAAPYEKKGELNILFNKAKNGGGLTPEESERLDWLIVDEKKQADKQFMEWKKTNVAR
jgi:hypothetical protein